MNTRLQHKVMEALDDTRRKATRMEYKTDSTDEEDKNPSSEEIHLNSVDTTTLTNNNNLRSSDQPEGIAETKERINHNFRCIRRALLEQSRWYEQKFPQNNQATSKATRRQQQQGITICLETATILMQIAKQKHKEGAQTQKSSKSTRMQMTNHIAQSVAEEHIPTMGATWEHQTTSEAEKLAQNEGQIQGLEEKRRRAIRRTRNQIDKYRPALATQEQRELNIIKIAWHLGGRSMDYGSPKENHANQNTGTHQSNKNKKSPEQSSGTAWLSRNHRTPMCEYK